MKAWTWTSEKHKKQHDFYFAQKTQEEQSYFDVFVCFKKRDIIFTKRSVDYKHARHTRLKNINEY